MQISLFVVSTATETVCCMGSRFGQIMCDWSRRFLQVDCHAVSTPVAVIGTRVVIVHLLLEKYALLSALLTLLRCYV